MLKANFVRQKKNNDEFPKACGMWLQWESSTCLHDYLCRPSKGWWGKKKSAIPASGGQAPSPFGVFSALPLLRVEHKETRRSKEEAFTASLGFSGACRETIVSPVGTPCATTNAKHWAILNHRITELEGTPEVIGPNFPLRTVSQIKASPTNPLITFHLTTSSEWESTISLDNWLGRQTALPLGSFGSCSVGIRLPVI